MFSSRTQLIEYHINKNVRTGFTVEIQYPKSTGVTAELFVAWLHAKCRCPRPLRAAPRSSRGHHQLGFWCKLPQHSTPPLVSKAQNAGAADAARDFAVPDTGAGFQAELSLGSGF
jgi:hypothetical protein